MRPLDSDIVKTCDWTQQAGSSKSVSPLPSSSMQFPQISGIRVGPVPSVVVVVDDVDEVLADDVVVDGVAVVLVLVVSTIVLVVLA